MLIHIFIEPDFEHERQSTRLVLGVLKGLINGIIQP